MWLIPHHEMVIFQTDEVFIIFTKDVLIFMLSHHNINNNSGGKKQLWYEQFQNSSEEMFGLHRSTTSLLFIKTGHDFPCLCLSLNKDAAV